MYNIVIVGVGGQGTLLASKILGQLAMNNGYDVRVSEVHGMSQRGGSVDLRRLALPAGQFLVNRREIGRAHV